MDESVLLKILSISIDKAYFVNEKEFLAENSQFLLGEYDIRGGVTTCPAVVLLIQRFHEKYSSSNTL